MSWTNESLAISPPRSVEENCLVWVVELVGGDVSDGWHSASCCNMHQFVCSRTLS